MQGRCEKHLFEGAEDRCGRCGYEFCGECLVYSFGLKKPPFCIPCAVAAAGIRTNAGPRPIGNARQMKQLRKEQRTGWRRQRREPAMSEPEFDGVAAMTPVPMPLSNALPAQF